MDTKDKVVLLSADLHDNGVIATFSNGKLAFYSAALLHSIFAQATELHGTAEDTESDRNTGRSR
jgi:hypothetical protein